MPLTKEQKKNIIEDLKEKLDKQKSMVFVAVAKLKAKDIFDLRNRLKEQDCVLSVVKKTLLSIAFKEKKLPVDIKKIQGEAAVIFGFKDELSAAKISNQFTLENENLKILGGFFANEFVGKEQVIVLAMIPSRNELLARLVGTIKAPISGLANVLQGNIKGLINVLAKAKT